MKLSTFRMEIESPLVINLFTLHSIIYEVFGKKNVGNMISS